MNIERAWQMKSQGSQSRDRTRKRSTSKDRRIQQSRKTLNSLYETEKEAMQAEIEANNYIEEVMKVFTQKAAKGSPRKT